MTIQTRATLDRELAELDTLILQLVSRIDEAIEQAMDALMGRDVELAREVIANDAEINSLRYEIEKMCFTILATQQPFAGDLRRVIATIHVATEMERIGDHASGIARLVERLQEEPEIESFYKLPKMAKRARKMIADGVQAYIDRDDALATRMVSVDEKLDKHYRQLFVESLEEMRSDENITRSTYLLWVGHNLERIGDRAINIAERVVFMVTGKYVEDATVIDL